MKEDLKFPSFENSLPPAGALSMDDYAAFVLMNLKSFPKNRDRVTPIPVRFVIREDDASYGSVTQKS